MRVGDWVLGNGISHRPLFRFRGAVQIVEGTNGGTSGPVKGGQVTPDTSEIGNMEASRKRGPAARAQSRTASGTRDSVHRYSIRGWSAITAVVSIQGWLD